MDISILIVIVLFAILAGLVYLCSDAYRSYEFWTGGPIRRCVFKALKPVARWLYRE